MKKWETQLHGPRDLLRVSQEVCDGLYTTADFPVYIQYTDCNKKDRVIEL